MDRRIWVHALCVASKADNTVLGGSKYQEYELVHGGCRGSKGPDVVYSVLVCGLL